MTAAPAEKVLILPVSAPAAMETAVDIRRRVFGNEQRILLPRYEDPEDSFSFNVLAWLDGQAVGTGRLSPAFDRSPVPAITWVATLAAFRGRGVARAIVQSLIFEADALNYAVVYLNSQSYVQELYASLGFYPVGSPQIIHGIRHQAMRRDHPERLQ